MITLIAESKTMLSAMTPTDENALTGNSPAEMERAEMIAAQVANMDAGDLARQLKVSVKLASQAVDEMKLFADRSEGYEALRGYTGVVFDAIDASSLTPDDMNYASEHLMIVSSLYGLLRPDDIIKKYRLDYNVKCLPSGKSLAQFWKEWNTMRLLWILQERDDKCVFNIMPGAASATFDWKEIKKVAKVITADFRIMKDSESASCADTKYIDTPMLHIPESQLSVPSSVSLKKMRGRMVREIIKQRIRNPEALLNLSSDGFIYLGDLKSPGHATFLSD